jgi:MYXO-CTERM domain-containing protein
LFTDPAERRQLVIVSLLPRLSLCAVVLLMAEGAQAAPRRVAVIGAQMVHSDKLQRSQEWPAMLQKMVGAEFDVQNFGDCCSSVSLDYPKQPETHPYLKPPNNAAFKPGFNESVAFMPDIVIIGPWGKHDRELTTEVFGGKLDPVKFAADYETMITTYQMLPTHPKIFASLPIPIPFGMASGVVNDVILPATKMVLARHPEIPVIDLWAPFVGHRELYNQDTGDRAGTHVTPTTGLMLIATTTYMVWKLEMTGGGSTDAAAPTDIPDASAPADTAVSIGGGGSGGSSGTPAGGSGGSGGSVATDAGSSGTPPARSSSGCSSGGAGGGRPVGVLVLTLALATLFRRRR